MLEFFYIFSKFVFWVVGFLEALLFLISWVSFCILPICCGDSRFFLFFVIDCFAFTKKKKRFCGNCHYLSFHRYLPIQLNPHTFTFVHIYLVHFEMLKLTPYIMENMKIDYFCIFNFYLKIRIYLFLFLSYI